MVYCPKCGNKVDEKMTFCTRCGALLKPSQPAPEAVTQTGAGAAPSAPYSYYREEKHEKEEKREKGEKGEKAEKHESGVFRWIGPVIGGLFLIFIGVVILFPAFVQRIFWALFFLAVGIIIIISTVWGASRASKRNPRT